MNHLDEQSIEQFLLGKAEENADSMAIRTHIDECEGCAALYREISGYYGDVDQLRNTHERTLAIANRISHSAPARDLPGGTIQRAADVVRTIVTKHPIRSTAFALGMASLLLMTFKPWRPESVEYARAKNEFLIAYDASGNELWRKHIGKGFDETSEASITMYQSFASSIIQTADVDEDGESEVVAAFGMMTDGWRDSIVCFETDGTEKWRVRFGRTMKFGATEFANDFAVDFISVADHDLDGSVDVIGYAHSVSYYPSAIFKLKALDGSLVGEYWHPGWLSSVEQMDINGDGRREFLFGGQNNSFERAAIVVLDPQTISGAAPTNPDMRPQGIGPGSEVAYILVPPSGLARFSDRPRGAVETLRISGDLLQAQIEEKYNNQPQNVTILFFDSTLTCISAGRHDDFEIVYRRFLADGATLKPLPQMYEDIRKGIRYWDGNAFVEQPILRRPSYLTPVQ